MSPAHFRVTCRSLYGRRWHVTLAQRSSMRFPPRQIRAMVAGEIPISQEIVDFVVKDSASRANRAKELLEAMGAQ